MHSATAVTALAPSSSTIPAPANSVESYVGTIVAAAGMAIAEALAERQDGGLSPATRTRGGDLICQLYGLRRFLIVDLPNFDSLAHEQGVVVLREAGFSPRIADLLASEVLDLLGKVVRTAFN